MRERERDGKREAAFPPSLPPPSFSPSLCHSYLWEIRLETVTEKRGGAKSGIRVATHALSAFLITSLILRLLKPRSSASQLQTVFFKFSLYLPFVSSYSSLLLILFHCRSNSRSLSELSVQTVEYMVPKYTSPLSLHLNKLQRGERKSGTGREEAGCAQRGWGLKKGNIQVKQHLHVQRLQIYRIAANQSRACSRKLVRAHRLRGLEPRWQLYCLNVHF